MLRRSAILLPLLLAVGCAPAAPAPPPTSPGDGPDLRAALDESAEVVRTVERFHEALAGGDPEAVLAHFTPGARIVEGGRIETLEEYREGHLSHDLRFLADTEIETGRIHAWIEGDAAWAVSTSSIADTERGREIAELAVLVRTPEGWRISAVHWSLRPDER